MEYNYVARNEDGTVNIHESVSTYKEALERWVARTEIQIAEIKAAVNSVLTLASLGAKPKNVKFEKLVGMALVKLAPSDGEEYDMMEKAVGTFVKANTGEGKLYRAVIGKGGGYHLPKKTAPSLASNPTEVTAMAVSKDEPGYISNLPPSEMDG